MIIEFTVRWKYGSIQPVTPRNGSDISTAELYPEWIFIQFDESASRSGSVVKRRDGTIIIKMLSNQLDYLLYSTQRHFRSI